MKKFHFSKIYLSLILVMALCVVSTFAHVSLANAKDEKSPRLKATLTDAYGESLKNYKTEFLDPASGQITAESINVKDLVFNNFYLSTDKVVIEYNGDSEFVDLVGLTSDGEYINLSGDATWISDDMSIAIADSGRILAQGKGKSTVTVTYGNYSQSIDVKVKNQIDIKQKIDEINNNGIQSFSLTSSERAQINTIAQSMCDQTWKPTSNLRGWRDEFTYRANTQYKGLPYSQTAYQCDAASFVTKLSATDFYTLYERTLNGESIKMPKYGNDCSGFVSFSWQISRNTSAGFLQGISDGIYPKVGSYTYKRDAATGNVITEATSTDLTNSYSSLQMGDAVVKSGHTFIVAINMGSYVYCFEQTPYLAQYTTWTYTQLANAGYKPFAKK